MMLPSFESSYLSTVGQKQIDYLGVITGVVENIQTQSHFSRMLNTGIVNPTKLILLFQLSSVSNASAAVPHSPNLSPFSTSPATTSPFILDSFQVKISGNNIYSEYHNYNYDMYLFEIGQMGGFTAPASRHEWESGLYKVMIIDLKRMLPDARNVSQSIQISGVNRTKLSLDCYWYIEHEKSVSLDLYSGKNLKS
jgi:hypothetical protein